MSSIPLPALGIRPPEQQPGPMDEFAKIQQLKSLLGEQQVQQQQIQAGQLENQQRQLALKDNQAMTAAMQDWDGKDISALPPLIIKHGGSAMAVMGMRQKVLESQEKASAIAKDDAQTGQTNTDTLIKKHDQIVGALHSLDDVPDDQLHDAIAQKVQSLGGLLSPQEMQQAQQLGQIQDPKQLRSTLANFEKSLTGFNAQLSQAKDKAQAEKDAADAAEKRQELAMGGNSAMADARYRSIQQRLAQGQKLSTDDATWKAAYEKQKLLVPQTVANIRIQGLEEMGNLRGMRPVTDTKTGITTYAMPTDIAKMNQAEPGRYQVPQYSPEAIITQQTAKAVAPGGTVGEEVNAYQTAIQHADLLRQAAKALHNGDTRALNSIKNQLSSQFGDPDLTNMQAISHVYQNEIQKMIAGGHITDNEITTNKATLPDNANYATIDRVLGSYQSLAQSKLDVRAKNVQQGLKGQTPLTAPQGGGSQGAKPPAGATHVGKSNLDGNYYYLDASGRKLGEAPAPK